MLKRALFIGRFQPLHTGHIRLVQSVLDEGKEVVVALRETPLTVTDPFTISERKEMFQKEFGNKVQVISIPDISELCYGRGVGYEVRELSLEKNIEQVSGTQIRGEKIMNRIIWIMGESGAGKTTTARLLRKKIGGVVLDGDEMRESISAGAGFSRQDRHDHNLRVSRLAVILAKQVPVIISVIAPLKETRKDIENICKPDWIYLKRKLPKRQGHIFEEPDDYFSVDANTTAPEQEVEEIIQYYNLVNK